MREHVTRRQFAITTGALGTLGVAGCLDNIGLGGGSGGAIRIGTASSTGSTYGYTQALQRGVAEHAETDVEISTQETSGMASNPYLIEQGQIDGMTSSLLTSHQALNEEEGFEEEPLDEWPLQAFNVSDARMACFALDGSGIETTDDLPGSNFWPLPPGFSTRNLVETVMRYAGYWDQVETYDIETGEAADALNEERVEVFFGYGWNSVVPSWFREIDDRLDIHHVEMVGDFREKAEEFPGADWQDEVEIADINQDVGTDTSSAFIDPTNYYFDASVSAEDVAEIMRVSHEHNDYIRDADEGYGDHTDAEDMFIGYSEDIPFHPGARDFYEDVGIWDDSLEVGEENFEI